MARTIKAMCGMLLAAVAATLSGCMVTPTEGQFFNSFASPIPTAGFTEHPGQTVHVEVFNVFTSNWDRLATTTSRTVATRWSDKNWYYWQTPSLTLLPRHWNLLGSGLLRAKIRAITPDGNAMFTFNEWNISEARDINDLDITGRFEVNIESVTFDPDEFYSYDPGRYLAPRTQTSPAVKSSASR